MFVNFLIGIITGIANGIIGSGSGLISLSLIKIKEKEKNAHAYTVLTVLCSTVVSTIMYAINGKIEFERSFNFIIGGVLAAPLGVVLLGSIIDKNLKRIFAVFLIFCGVRMFYA